MLQISVTDWHYLIFPVLLMRCQRLNTFDFKRKKNKKNNAERRLRTSVTHLGVTFMTLRLKLCISIGDSPVGSDFRSVTTCDGRSPGEHEVYRSQSHELTITVVSSMALKSLGKFVIGYRGMSSWPPNKFSTDSSIRRTDKMLLIQHRLQMPYYLKTN